MSAPVNQGFEVRNPNTTLAAHAPVQVEVTPDLDIRTASTAPHAAFPGSEVTESRLRRRALLVTGVVWLPVLALLGAVWFYLGPQWAALLLLLQVLGLLLTLWQTFRGARRTLRRTELHPITARTQPALHALCTDVATRMGVELPPCYIMETKEVNAFATMVGLRRPVFVLNTGFLAIAHPDAVRGVIGHELAHIVNRDLLVTAVALGSGRLVTSTGSVAGRVRNSWRRKSTAEELLDMLRFIFGRAIPWLYRLLFQALSRSRESLADLTAARALGGADPMIASLRLLARASSEARDGEAGRAGRMNELQSSHPALRRRIELLLDTCGQQVSRLPER